MWEAQTDELWEKRVAMLATVMLTELLSVAEGDRPTARFDRLRQALSCLRGDVPSTHPSLLTSRPLQSM